MMFRIFFSLRNYNMSFISPCFSIFYSHPKTSSHLPLLGLKQDLLHGAPASNLTLPKSVFCKQKNLSLKNMYEDTTMVYLKSPMTFRTLRNNSKALSTSIKSRACPWCSHWRRSCPSGLTVSQRCQPPFNGRPRQLLPSLLPRPGAF